jgi:hypothetical protein
MKSSHSYFNCDKLEIRPDGSYKPITFTMHLPPDVDYETYHVSTTRTIIIMFSLIDIFGERYAEIFKAMPDKETFLKALPDFDPATESKGKEKVDESPGLGKRDVYVEAEGASTSRKVARTEPGGFPDVPRRGCRGTRGEH